MDLARERIGVSEDYRARGHEIAGLRIFPSILKARQAQHGAVCCADEIWLLAVWPLEPLIIATRRCIAEHRLVATLSARALKVGGNSFSGFFHQYGTSPQRIDTSPVEFIADF
jgi:hypothetical protein